MKAIIGRFGLLALACVVALSATAGCERKPATGGANPTTGDIPVGFYGSLTGESASFGISAREGTELAVDEVNAAGGVLGGRKLKLIVEDDQSKTDEASSAVTKMITQDKVVTVLGEVSSSRSLAAAPVCQRFSVPMITPASTNDKITKVGDYIFRTCYTDSQQGRVLAEFAYNDLKARRAAILKDVGKDYSVGLTASIEENFKRLGGEVLPVVSYGSTDQDFRAILTQIREQKPDAIFATGYYPEAAIIVRQARELGITVPILGGDGWVGDSLQGGREALNNCFLSNHFATDDPDPTLKALGQKFVAAYKARFGKEPDAMAALSYDSVYVLADALNRAGSTDGTKLRDAIAATSIQGVTGKLAINETRNVDKPTVIQEVVYKDGAMKFVYKTTIKPN